MKAGNSTRNVPVILTKLFENSYFILNNELTAKLLKNKINNNCFT